MSSLKQPRRNSLALLILAMGLMTAVSSPASADDSFRIAGAVPKPVEWTVARLKSELASDIKSIDYTIKGKKHTANCVALMVVLASDSLPPQVGNTEARIPESMTNSEWRMPK